MRRTARAARSSNGNWTVTQRLLSIGRRREQALVSGRSVDVTQDASRIRGSCEISHRKAVDRPENSIGQKGQSRVRSTNIAEQNYPGLRPSSAFMRYSFADLSRTIQDFESAHF